MKKSIGRLLAAAVIYAGFAVYLYQPYFKHFDTSQYLIVVNACVAAVGCYILSRRWVAVFAGSLFAGAVYGFGPFSLALAKFHPTAGFLAAMVPWLLLPAAFIPKDKWRWVQVPLSALPFVVIILFFKVAEHFVLFPVPVQVRLRLADLGGVFAVLVAAKRNLTLTGFYHIPIATLVMGFVMLWTARRFAVMVMLAIGLVLAFCKPLFGTVSPIIWLTFPVLCCSVLIGVGFGGLVSAGPADRKWPLATAVVMLVLSIVTLLLATKCQSVFAGFGAKYANMLVQTGKMYVLGATAVGIIFFMARAKVHIRWLRLTILSAAMAMDIFLSARLIVCEVS